MEKLSLNNKLKLFEFLNDEITLSEFQNFIFQTKELEDELETEIYNYLILFNPTDENEIKRVKHLVSKIISEREFETWKLTELLKKFITEPQKIKEYLDIFYDLFCGSFDEEKHEIRLGYTFLEHLGLNYFWWMDESYLELIYGDGWENEYQKSLNNFEFYHNQLKPYAEKILNAINLGEIKILSKGVYEITERLKQELESEKIFLVKHPFE
jgi:hypothetical protein